MSVTKCIGGHQNHPVGGFEPGHPLSTCWWPLEESPVERARPGKSWLLSKQSSIEPGQAHISRAPVKTVHDSLLRPVPHLEEDITDRLQKEVTSGSCCVRVSCV